MHFFKIILAVASIHVLGVCVLEAQIDERARQLIVTRTADWNSHRGAMMIYQRQDGRAAWRPAAQQWVPVLLGRNGSAWGRGAFEVPRSAAPVKREKDGRAPAGVFALGTLFGNSEQLLPGAQWPYVQVGPYDAYIDDPLHPQYNQHVRVRPGAVPPWFEKQRMRLGDDAYKWMIEIRHNQGPAIPHHGSAIFFHVRRGPDRPSAGCTTMALESLEALIRWLRRDQFPYYVLLPDAEYEVLRPAWRLP